MTQNLAPTKVALERKVIALASDPTLSLSQEEIAQICDTSRSTVARILRRCREDLKDVQNRVSEYQRLIGQAFPVEDRVQRYRELIQQNEQLMVSLKALERIDALDGIVTAREKKEKEEIPQTPMFILPEGSQVQVNITRENAPPAYRKYFEDED